MSFVIDESPVRTLNIFDEDLPNDQQTEWLKKLALTFEFSS